LIYNNKKVGIPNVIKIYDLVTEGVTEPVKCRLDNGTDAVVKYQRNRFGSMVLVNEWIGCHIADLMGLTIPGYGLCTIPQDVILNSDIEEGLGINNSGLAFFSEYIAETVPINEFFLSKVSNKEVERIILFDILVGDLDRHKGNILCSLRSNKLYFIDCSHIITSEGYSLSNNLNLRKELSEEKLFDISLLTNPDNIYNILCSRVGYREDILFREAEHIKSVLTDDAIDSIFESIPREWYTSDQARRRVDDMRKILKTKFSMTDELTAVIALERRSGEWKKY